MHHSCGVVQDFLSVDLFAQFLSTFTPITGSVRVFVFVALHGLQSVCMKNYKTKNNEVERG